MWGNENCKESKLSLPKTRSSIGTVKMSRLWLVCMNECEWDKTEVTVCDAIGLAWDKNLNTNGLQPFVGSIKGGNKCFLSRRVLWQPRWTCFAQVSTKQDIMQDNRAFVGFVQLRQSHWLEEVVSDEGRALVWLVSPKRGPSAMFLGPWRNGHGDLVCHLMNVRHVT